MFEFVIVSWFLNFGVVPQMLDSVNNTIVSVNMENKIPTVAELGLSAKLWDKLTIAGSMENLQFYNLNTHNGFYPYRINYKIAMSYDFTKNISIIVSHECDHPVSYCTNGNLMYNYGKNDTRVYVHFQGTMPF